MTGIDQRLDDLHMGLQSIYEGTMTSLQRHNYFFPYICITRKDRMLIFMKEKITLKLNLRT